jgi:hypothetical protein
MLRHSNAKPVCLLGGLMIAVSSQLLSGCGSPQAGASAGAAVATNPADPPSATSSSNPAAPPRPRLKPGAKTVALARAGDRPYDKTFDDLRFEMTLGEKFKRSMLTENIEQLNGQRIRIRGYILPTPQKRGITQFVLVRDNQECCFGPGAALYDCILVEMKPGNTADFTIRPIAVEGTFEVHEFAVGGKYLAIYRMSAESAR